MSALVRPQFATVEGLSVGFAEGGEGDQDAIPMSPWPESVFGGRKIAEIALGTTEIRPLRRDPR